MNKINRNRMRDRTFETNVFLFTQDCIREFKIPNFADMGIKCYVNSIFS